MVGCYNRGDESHFSANCNKSQRYSRCNECDNVCINPSKQKPGCNNKEFISSLLKQRSTIVEIERLVELAFKPLKYISVYMDNEEKIIGKDQCMVIGNSFIQLRRMDIGVAFEAPRGDEMVIVVMSKEGKRRLKLFISDAKLIAWLIVNEYYDISKSGAVKFNLRDEQNTYGRCDCFLKLNNDSTTFQVRVKWASMALKFECFRDGVLFLNPIEKHVKQTDTRETIVNDVDFPVMEPIV